ncbi:tetraacyldisaccharide 4'-kinase [Agarivorans sp. TSD2052]|uniref:tetraacyldisaccharide 4'-kinase n=1 Tax=Agarivorans sp. TSD2052 TaxID=2937286 RepID=UPI00200DB15A|nr:tetraacyldisaccharide 4'-kinase [Agarivorans sp. TSD2052]UPW16839.1 tetraacyldisaccharide 4'-kinase [Agarivorans sp. TSD2052]
MKFWYQACRQHPVKTGLLLPLSYLFRLVTALRRLAFRCGILKVYQAKVPVVVVGNISVGGNGKTPVVLALVEAAKQQGFRPGVVSRGYGAKAPSYPYNVGRNSLPAHCGDEPLLIHLRTECPVVVDPNRSQACQAIIEHDVNLIICDDGMQHYALGRDLEIAVIDAERRLGNRLCLPAGPLREPPVRLRSVDMIVTNGQPAFSSDSFELTLQACPIRRVNDNTLADNLTFADLAFAGIGNPKRFFESLKQLGIEVSEQLALSDHRRLEPEQQREFFNKTLIMTEKDAIKYRQSAGENWYYLPVDSKLPESFYQRFFSLLQEKTDVRRS